MRRKTLNKVAAGVASVVGTIGLLGSVAQPSHAQAVQANTVFGCDIPGAGRVEDPFNAGIDLANGLIATPTFPTPVPTQADLAYFSTAGTMTGQARCLVVQTRLNTLNSPQNYATLAGHTFGL